MATNSNPVNPPPPPQPQPQPPSQISITDLLKRLSSPSTLPGVSPTEIALAFSRVFENRLSPIQLASLLTLLHSTTLDRSPSVIAACALAMRSAATPISRPTFLRAISPRKARLARGAYGGGLCDIVGTGGDSHSTFNISTTASIIASALLLMAKHGNRAQTSKSGSADVLNAILPTPPRLEAVRAANLHRVYSDDAEQGSGSGSKVAAGKGTNYAFLYAPNFHSGMRHAAGVRRELGLRTIFNIMGPLANPVEWALEARVVGVAATELGPRFAEALRLSGARKALVVCGREQLDEISCAGETDVWMLSGDEKDVVEELDEDDDDDEAAAIRNINITTFTLHPSDFGLRCHPLSTVGGGHGPAANAVMLLRILRNELPADHPILHFVLMNVAALLVVSGICEADGPGVITERGPGGGRWKEGVRRARWCVESGGAVRELEAFIQVSNRLAEEEKEG